MKKQLFVFVLLVISLILPSEISASNKAKYKKEWKSIDKPYRNFQNNSNLKFNADKEVLDSIVGYERYNDNWFYFSLETHKYDLKTNLIEYLWEDFLNSVWIKDFRWLYDYDVNNNLLVEKREDWKDSFWEMVDIYDYIYDEDNLLIESINEYWYDGEFYEVSAKYYYDDNKKLIKIEGSFKSFDVWILFVRDTYHYDNKDNLESILTENYENDSWFYTSNRTFKYDENYNLIEFIQSDWVDGNWLPAEKINYNYDSNQNLIEQIQQIDVDGILTNELRFEFKYENNRISILYWDFWYESFSDWDRTFMDVYKYKTLSDVEDGKEKSTIASFPNPFTNSTTIKYNVDDPARVRINVYDNLGREISTLIDEFQDAGVHQARFNAENLPQGMYYYKIQIGQQIESGKLLLIR